MEDAALETAALAERLRSFSLSDGGFPYYRDNASSLEPTLLAALAFSASGAPADVAKPALEWVRERQGPDGSVGIDAQHLHQGLWLTALAAVAFRHFGLRENAKRALEFLISIRSVIGPKNSRLGQDDNLPGWPWVPGTFGWVEPTAWSLIALSLSGLRGHSRAVEGARFLLDRQIPSGGWNYGSPSLDGQELLPFWDTTGLALVALRGAVDPARVGPSLDFMEREQKRIESLSGLSWAVLSLSSYRRNAGPSGLKLLNVLRSIDNEELHIGNYSLGLIALSEKRVLIP